MIDSKSLDQYRNMEIFCFQTFSSGTKRDWGTMLYNPDILTRHDANHTEVINPANPDLVLSEIEEFYKSKNIPSRINYYNPSNDDHFKKALIKNKFTCVDPETNFIFMKLDKKIEIMEYLNENDNYKVSFCPAIITESHIVKDIEYVIHSDWEYQNIVSNENYYYFILYDLNTPVSVLSFFLYEPYMLARMDDVITVPDCRNKGYSTFLLKFACNWVQNNDFIPYCYVHSFNGPAIKVYKKIGFKEIFSCNQVNWVKE